MIIIRLITVILQSLLTSYLVVYCVDKNEINKMKLLSIFIILMIILSPLFTGNFSNNTELAVFGGHIVGVFAMVLLYKNNIKAVVSAYTIVYSILAFHTIIFNNLIFESIRGIISNEYINSVSLSIIYITQWVIIFLCFRYIKKIRYIYEFIMRENFATSILIVSFLLDFTITLYLLTLGKTSQILMNIIEVVFLIFFVFIIIYFSKVNNKSREIFELNDALEIKNDDLSKIKHDYGAQISYLYGLCLMERFDDLKQALKNIINTNKSTPSAVEINKSNNSLLSLVLNQALEQGIHVIIKGDGDIGLCTMPEMELYRVLSNIVDNAIKAMNGKGIIIVNAYEELENIIIKIENNGPQINEELVDKIFEVGFTTKKNNKKSHGFGLSIVKDLIESYNGKILLRSNNISTEFKLILPIKEIKNP